MNLWYLALTNDTWHGCWTASPNNICPILPAYLDIKVGICYARSKA